MPAAVLTDPLARAAELHRAALAENDAGRPVAANRLLSRALVLLTGTARVDERAADALSDVAAELAARIVLSKAKAAAEVAGLDEAMSWVGAAAELATRRSLRSLEVSIANQRGILLLRFGDSQGALREFQRAEDHLAAAPAIDACKVLLNRAVARLDRGDLAAARADLGRCAELAARSELPTQRAMAEHNLGYVEFLAGNLVDALRVMQSSRRPEAGIPIGVSYLDEARVLLEAGLTGDADRALAQASQLFRRDKVTQDLAEAELARAGCALLRGDPDAARRLAVAARDRFRRRGNDRWRRAAQLVVLQCDLATGRSAGLLRLARQLQAEFGSDGLGQLAAAAGLIAAEAQLATGALDACAATLARLPRGANRPITERMQAHYVHAWLACARGRGPESTRRIRRALDELARYQARFGSIDLRTAAAVHGRRLAELDIAFAVDTGRPAAVFAAAERARAASSRLPPVRPPEDRLIAELLAELRRTVESLRPVEHDRAAAAPFVRRRRELEREIIARGWTVSGDGAADRPATVGQVRARLAERNRTMVNFVQSGGQLFVVVVGDRLRLRRLGPAGSLVEDARRLRADLDVLARDRLPGGIRAAVRASLHRALHRLDAALIGGLPLDLPLVIVSTGVLGQLPWASLPSLRGRSIVVAPSATKWLSSTMSSRTRPSSVAAFAGPALHRGEAELAGIRAAWRVACTRAGADATTSAFVAAMSEADVLHVAAHGVHQPENPLFSSVRMADGPVFAHELERHGQAPEHVVLSACEVGLATIRPGDEALGLASVLLNLGTRSVIASVARVGDDIAAETMARYHARLAGGTDSAAALAAALAEVETDVVPPFVNFGAAWSPDLEPAEPVT